MQFNPEDSNERFILRHCFVYFRRILNRYWVIDEEYLDIFAVIAGEECSSIGKNLAERMQGRDRYSFQQVLKECAFEPEA